MSETNCPKCPHCGDVPKRDTYVKARAMNGTSLFCCGTYIEADGFVKQSDRCKIATLTQQLATATSELAAARGEPDEAEKKHDQAIISYGKILSEAKRDRDSWKRQHDMVLAQAQKDNLRAEDADRYEQWLLDLGRISGCGHVDERLPRCIEEAFEAERQSHAATQDQLAKYDAELANCCRVLSRWPLASGCNGHLCVSGHIGNILDALAASEAELAELRAPPFSPQPSE